LIDITIIGGGNRAAACSEALARAGFRVFRTLDMDPRDRSPLIVGDAPTAYALAREAVEAGRHVLVASPAALTPDRISLLMETRRKGQAVFVWSERRSHPGYRLVSGLIEADGGWRPRFVRQQTFTTEAPSRSLARWLTLEAMAVVLALAGQAPQAVAATSVVNPTRHAPEFISAALSFPRLEAQVQVALGDPQERRETLLASADRKAFVDELNASMPVRLIEEERNAGRSPSRWLTCNAPSESELARRQCLVFLDATLKGHLAADEAELWQRAVAATNAVERCLARDIFEPLTERGADAVTAGRPETLAPRLINR
jgi:predicted dehydrogenase